MKEDSGMEQSSGQKAQITSEQEDELLKLWASAAESISEAENQLLNWLFAVHAGGIAGLLAYAASKEGSSNTVMLGLASFSAGLVLLLAYGALHYYLHQYYFGKFKANLGGVYSGKLTYEKMSQKIAEVPQRYVSCEVIAWISALLAVAGMIFAFLAIV